MIDARCRKQEIQIGGFMTLLREQRGAGKGDGDFKETKSSNPRQNGQML